MTTEKFKKIDKSTIYCESCNRSLSKKIFSPSYVREDATASRCKCCDWIIRHDGIPNIEGYSKDVIRGVIESILLNERESLNQISNNNNMTLEETIKLVTELKIGNKKLFISTKCTQCDKKINMPLSVYKRTEHHFCNKECYWTYKRKKTLKGEKSSYYKRIETKCTNCQKKIKIIPYNYNLLNAYGDNHNFYSQKCYWEFRKKYYIKDKSPVYKRIVTTEQKQIMRKNMIKNLQNSERLNTKIQLKVNDILNKNNIQYDREYQISFYSVDNYLKEFNLIIEVMGDYWHSSPIIYGKDKRYLNQIQYKGIIHDKQKETYIYNHCGIHILYLWEKDINQFPDKCEALILQYINSNGQLENYHSFNYVYDNSALYLKSQLIIPYQNQNISISKKLLVN